MPPLLEVEDVHKSYGDHAALRGVSFDVEPGTITALLGPNGSGKSTLMRSTVTLETLDRGRIRICGVDVGADPQRARTHLGYAGQEMALDKVLTGREFLRFQAGLVHLSRSESKSRIEELLTLFDLQDAANRATETYSGGMKRRLDLAASLLHRPQLLVLDEPSTGIDLEGRRRFWEILLRLKDNGTSLLIATHDFEETDRLAADVVMLREGEIAKRGAPEALRSELGSYILTASLKEHAEDEDKKSLRELFESLGATPLPDEPSIAEVGAAVHGDDDDARAWVDRLHDTARERGQSLFSAAIHRPTLTDVYRASIPAPRSGETT